jgi:membrane protein implicated in regulation of membrane protease activity
MNDNEMALSVLVKGIVSTIKKTVNQAKFNRGVTGRVIAQIAENHYTVQIAGQTYTARSRFTYQADDVVKIIMWNNNFNELYIIY